jgi:hypothetical protein
MTLIVGQPLEEARREMTRHDGEFENAPRGDPKTGLVDAKSRVLISKGSVITDCPRQTLCDLARAALAAILGPLVDQDDGL